MEQTPITNKIRKGLIDLGVYGMKVIQLLDKVESEEQLHREKYKHTKEDVIEAYDIGWENGSGQGNIKGIETTGEQYYQNEHENK